MKILNHLTPDEQKAWLQIYRQDLRLLPVEMILL